jgi:hypothetical protein
MADIALVTLFLSFYFFATVTCQVYRTQAADIDDNDASIIYQADTATTLYSQWYALDASNATSMACSTCLSRELNSSLVYGGAFDSFPLDG